MDFIAVVDQVIALLRQRGRVAYRTLKRQFQLDDEALEDLKIELIDSQRLATDEQGTVLVWTGEAASPPAPTAAAVPASAPLGYTPPYLVEKILTSRSALEGERKQVTVLFADLKGSMELLADRDPEEARQLLDPVLERMMAAVHRYEGTVNQIMGDGIMALFGAPIAHEDHAVRACYAALAMHTAIQTYAETARRTHGISVQMRVGLNSGEVVVRAIGNDLHMDYSAVGQTTHLAARMEQLATPGSILLTADTLRLVEGLVQVTALGPVPVKGLADPVEVFALVGASPLRGRFQASAARGLTRFVGREQELTALQQALEQAEAGHGQVAALVGEAGVGKSRLVYEFVHSHHTQRWRVLESASVSYGKATPYFPVIDLLRRYGHIEDQDDIRTIRAKVTGQVLTLDAGLQDTLPALLSLLDALPEDSPFRTLDPPQRRQRMLDGLKRVLLRESQVQPLVLVCEDLHWIDSETQALLNSLVESLPTARLLLLVNYRPEYQHSWGSKTYYTQLRLDPLPPVSADEFLQALLGDDPRLGPLKQLLITRTEGNPFFLEESVRTLVEMGVLVGEPGAYRLIKPLDSLQMPATVQAVLAARIDRLPSEEKQLLQTAAVVGTEVPLPLLQTIADMPEAVLHRGLAHLQAAEFLYETRLFPEREYTFKHALTHEVAYNGLLLERRQVLHARLVEALETLTPDQVIEHVEGLAYHALRGEVWEKAVTYCQQAGAKAYDGAAFREAVTAFESALQALAHLPEPTATGVLAIDLRLALARPVRALGEHRRRLALLDEARAIAMALDDQARLGRVLASMALVFRAIGDLDSAITAGRQAIDLAMALNNSVLQWEASLHLGQAYCVTGDFGRAAELLRRNVEAPDHGLDTFSTDVRIESQAWLATVSSALGNFAEGQRHAEEALLLATSGGRGAIPIIAYGSLGQLHCAKGDIEQAIRALRQCVALCHASGHKAWLRYAAACLGYASALQGHLTEGRALLEEAISESVGMGGPRGLGGWTAWLSEVWRLLGNDEEARKHACQALDLTRQTKERPNEALALHQLGVVQAHAAPPDAAQAEIHYQQALALAEELGMRPLVAHCHLGLGTLYATTGQQEQARAELSMAIALYRAMEMTFWLPQAEAALAQVAAQ